MEKRFFNFLSKRTITFELVYISMAQLKVQQHHFPDITESVEIGVQHQNPNHHFQFKNKYTVLLQI